MLDNCDNCNQKAELFHNEDSGLSYCEQCDIDSRYHILRADLHDLRIRANMIERAMSMMMPGSENADLMKTWSEAMDLCGEQFRAIVAIFPKAK